MQCIYGSRLRAILLAVFLTISQICLAEYVELDPPFVVNLASDSEIKFAQVSAQVRVKGSEAITALNTHAPAIRHALVMLLSSKSAKQVSSREGKQTLREEALQAIRTVMEEQHVKLTPIVEEETEEAEGEDNKAGTKSPIEPIQDVFFTRFIIQ